MSQNIPLLQPNARQADAHQLACARRHAKDPRMCTTQSLVSSATTAAFQKSPPPLAQRRNSNHSMCVWSAAPRAKPQGRARVSMRVRLWCCVHARNPAKKRRYVWPPAAGSTPPAPCRERYRRQPPPCTPKGARQARPAGERVQPASGLLSQHQGCLQSSARYAR